MGRHRGEVAVVKSRIVILFLLLAGFASAQSVPSKDPGAAVRKRIFKERFLDHFTLGVEAPTEWLIETREKNGCRWDCSTLYLSGGAGTGDKPYWLNINKLIGDAKKAGVIPWYTYYNLAQSAPARYKPNPPAATVVNAKVAATMKDYFATFKTVLEGAAKEAPWPVMMHIEPDEWCHLLLSAQMDPAKVDIKVGSTGMEELKGLPDNLIGYAAAMKRLRDLYAPTNVLLGGNPSAFDYNNSMSGVKMGQMFKLLTGDWDFAVFETGDRDKGSEGKPPPYGSSINVTANLENHLKWIADFHATSGLHVFVWQVAAGNSTFATCNNTDGHWCDNLAELLLEGYPQNPTIGRYARAGCSGWMFLGGQDNSTRVYDFKKDGITNPAPVAGNLGKKSEVADDDGGYMRLRGGAYYRKPFPILGKGSTKTSAPEPKPEAKSTGIPR